MRTRFLALPSLAVLTLSATHCAWRQTVVPPPNQAGVERGFHMYEMPRTGGGAGHVFRVDQDNVQFAVTDLNVPTSEEGIAIAKFTEKGKRTATASMLASYSGIGAINAQLETDRVVRLALSVDGARRIVIQDEDLDPLLPELRRKINWRDNNRYFIIREAIRVNRLDFTLDRESADQLGIGGNVDEQVTLGQGDASAQVSARREAGSTFRLTQAFTPPHYVFYKIEELIRMPVPGASGGESYRLEKIPVKTPIQVRRVSDTQPEIR